MSNPGYPAARLVAERLHTHFASHHLAAKEQLPYNLAPQRTLAPQYNLAPLPDSKVIEQIIDAAFWTSLRREEQHPPRISIAFVPPEQAVPSLIFEKPLSLSPMTLTRVAPGVERPGIHLGAWQIDGNLHIWGATRSLPTLCFVVETVAPGLLVVKHRWSDEAAKFINVAVLEADQIKILDNKFSNLPGCPSVLGSLFGSDFKNFTGSESSHVLIRLAVSMRAHGRGGSLLVVPSGTDAWRESIAQPLSYSVFPPYSELATMVREAPEMREQRPWREALSRSIDAVAGLTAIDGATVITDDFEVLAFGAKIVRPHRSSPVEVLAITEPTMGAELRRIPPTELGGTRHLSAAQFTYDQRDALAFVASQDGPFTIFSWAECEKILFGYRVETLLL